MINNSCHCGGNSVDNFYSLFNCSHASCLDCYLNNNKCNNGCNNNCSSDSSLETSQFTCINYYDINLENVIASKIKAFGYIEKHNALALKFTDGTKKLILNVNKSIYDELCTLNNDTIYNFLKNNINNNNQCINIP